MNDRPHRQALATLPVPYWGFLDLEKRMVAAWSESFRSHAPDTRFLEPTTDTTTTPFKANTSGWIIECHPSHFPRHRDWIARQRQELQPPLLIGWSHCLAQSWQELYLEAGLHLGCWSFDQLPRVAKIAITHGQRFAVESDPIVATLQRKVASTLAGSPSNQNDYNATPSGATSPSSLS